MFISRSGWWALACLGLLALVPSRAGAVSLTEIHYNPPGTGESLEFVELTNDTSTPRDLSGYFFAEGIQYTFPPGSILPAHGIWVLVSDADAFSAEYPGVEIRGVYSGQLDNGGDRLTLVNYSGVREWSVRYSDDGQWPVTPDGTGHTLSLRNVHLELDEPESWAPSLEPGGTPGRLNFPVTGAEYVETEIVPLGSTWRYLKGSSPLPAGWRTLELDDSGWLEGPTGIGYDDGDDATVLDDMRNNYASVAARKVFTLEASDLQGPGELFLAIDFDDGFCAYLNGEELARRNCGEVGQDHPWNSVSTGVREAGAEEFFVISPADLLLGENILAITVHNQALGSSDLSLAPRIIRRVPLESVSQARLAFNELFRGDSPWVEIHNLSGFTVDLGGHRISTGTGGEPVVTIPAGTTIPARGFGVIALDPLADLARAGDLRLFLLGPDDRALAGQVFDRLEPEDADFLVASEARLPDGTGRLQVAAGPTPGAANEVERITDVVISEIFFHPPGERQDEFVELHNRSDSPVDLGGCRFSRGIDFEFPAPTVIGPGEYLVVARDPAATAAAHGLGGVLGPFEGRLADGGENLRLVDGRGNTLDEVRYHDGGSWPGLADGGGSSLELIDPFQDNSVAAAWSASDESEKSTWEELAFDVADYIPGPESELHLYLLEGGACRIDDVEIRRAGGSNFIPNPGFETSTAGWVIQGTHIHSRRTEEDAHGGGASLELIASAGGDTTVNRIEIDTSPVMGRGPYRVSLWARWLEGGDFIIAHAEFSAGPYGQGTGPSGNLSGNPMAARLRMTIPENLGSPGAENGATRRLRELLGEANLGPVISEVRHEPVLPSPGELVTIRARVQDSEGVAGVQVHHRLDSAEGVFSSVDLLDDGQAPDEIAGDGIFAGRIPGADQGRRTVFYLEATDGAGQGNVWPDGAPDSTFTLMADGAADHARLETLRVYLDQARTQELTSRALHSNDLLEGSFVFNHEAIHHQVGVRYRGSPWGRPGRTNYRVRFPKDDRYHRGRREINLSSRAGSIREGAAHYLQGRVGSESTPAPVADYHYVRASFHGGGQGLFAMIQPVNGRYLEKWYGDHPDHLALKAVGRLAFTDQGTRRTWDGANLRHRDLNPENYRGYYKHVVEQSRDSWEGLMDLTLLLDRGRTSSTELDARVEDLLDLEAFIRVFTPLKLTDGWDAFTVGNGHNGYLVFDGVDRRWKQLPFDMDNSFRNPTVSLYASQDPEVGRLITRPLPRRIYLRVLNEYFDGAWDEGRASPWLDQLRLDVGHDPGSIKTFLRNSKNALGGLVTSANRVSFRILTGGGEDFFVDESPAALEGEAPVGIESILAVIDGGVPVVFEPEFIGPTRFRGSLEVAPGANEVELFGFDSSGNLVEAVSVTITHTGGLTPPYVTGVTPDEGPADGGNEVVLSGLGFNDAIRVQVGGREVEVLDLVADDELRLVVPRAAFPFRDVEPVDIRVEYFSGETRILERAYTYELERGFVRGDATDDGIVDLADALGALGYLFVTGEVECLDGADFDDSGRIELSDVVGLLRFLFLREAPPAPPYPFPGRDPTGDGMGC